MYKRSVPKVGERNPTLGRSDPPRIRNQVRRDSGGGNKIDRTAARVARAFSHHAKSSEVAGTPALRVFASSAAGCESGATVLLRLAAGNDE